eukprot:364207-Chlamydomonas_euryale.AAC.5
MLSKLKLTVLGAWCSNGSESNTFGLCSRCGASCALVFERLQQRWHLRSCTHCLYPKRRVYFLCVCTVQQPAVAPADEPRQTDSDQQTHPSRRLPRPPTIRCSRRSSCCAS